MTFWKFDKRVNEQENFGSERIKEEWNANKFNVYVKL